MRCQKCGKQPATTRFKRTVNGVTEEWMLCDDCAAAMGFNQLSFFTGGFLGSLFGPDILEQAADHAIRCPTCGTSFEEIARTGLMGCADCYNQFRHRLAPTIEKLHGRAEHVGKRPAGAKTAPAQAEPADELAALKQALAQAVEAQEYERAATLRDEIRAKEEQNHEQQ